jgi:AAA domain
LELPGLPEKGDVSNWLDNGGTVDELVKLTENAAQEEVSARLSKIFEKFEEIELAPEEEYVIDEVLPARGIGLLYAPPGFTKTFLVLDMGLSIARGIRFANRYDTECGGVVYIALEAPNGVRKRVIAYKQEHRANNAAFALLRYPLNICDTGSVDGLIALLAEYEAHMKLPIRLVVFDTMAKAMGGLDENKAADAGKAIQGMQRIQEATRRCVLGVHHTGKDEARGLRGSSALSGNVDFVLRVDGTKDSPKNLVAEKMKDGEEKPVATYTLEKRVLGETAKGKIISSMVVKYIDGVPTKVRPRLSDEQSIIMNELDHLIIAGRFEVIKVHDRIQEGTTVVRRDDLMDAYFRKKGIMTPTERTKPKKDAFGVQLRRMEKNSYLGQMEGKVWKLKQL